MVEASCIRPHVIQVHSPIYGTTAFNIHFIVVFVCNLNGNFWEMDQWNKKNVKWIVITHFLPLFKALMKE